MIKELLKKAGFTCDISVDYKTGVIECIIYKNGIMVERIGCWGLKATEYWVSKFIKEKGLK